MSQLVLESMIVLALLVFNGLLAMSEIALVTARRARLERRADAGDRRAAAAVALASEPTQFLSTVQVGITLVGILAGAFGGATIADKLAEVLVSIPGIAPYAAGVAFALVVAAITYLSLIVGELVPKRIALGNPERIAMLVARPMHLLARVSGPLVRLLTTSTNFVLRTFGLQRTADAVVTEEDVRALVAQATATGTIHAGEEAIVQRVLRLGDRPVRSIMTPRTALEWVDPDEGPEAIRRLLIDGRHSRLLVCRETVDNVVGLVLTQDLLRQCVQGKPLDVQEVLKLPLFVPETTSVLRLLEMFRKSRAPATVVLDEFGGVQGLVTLSDIFESLVGELPENWDASGPPEPEIVRRPEGGWLVDGSTAMEELEEELDLVRTEEERDRDYRTVGGLVLTHLGHLPRIGESVEVDGFRFEVVDMDGRRIDRVLVTPVERTEVAADES
jgi:putative hemolysin